MRNYSLAISYAIFNVIGDQQDNTEDVVLDSQRIEVADRVLGKIILKLMNSWEIKLACVLYKTVDSWFLWLYKM